MKLNKRDLAASYKRFYSGRSGSGSSPYRRSDYEYYVDEDNDEDNGEIFEFDGVTSRKDKLGRSRGRGKDYGSSRKDYGRRGDYNYKDYIKDDPYYLRDNGGYYGYGRDGVDRSGYGYDDGGGGGAKDRADHYGGHSGYGHGHGHKKECCPLVIKPLVFLALLGSIAAATAFFNILITMNLGRKRRRRRRSYDDGNSGSSIGPGFADVLHAGTCHMINRDRKSPSTSAVHLPPFVCSTDRQNGGRRRGDAASEISKGENLPFTLIIRFPDSSSPPPFLTMVQLRRGHKAMCVVLLRYVAMCGRRRRPEATHKEKKKKAMMTEEKIGKMEGVGGIGLFIHCCAEVVVSEAEERLTSSSSSSSKCCRFSPFSPSFPFPTVVACIDRQATARQAGYPRHGTAHMGYGGF